MIKADYFGRAVQKTLVDMTHSGVIRLRTAGRKKHYWLKADYRATGELWSTKWTTTLAAPNEYNRSYPVVFTPVGAASLRNLVRNAGLRMIL